MKARFAALAILAMTAFAGAASAQTQYAPAPGGTVLFNSGSAQVAPPAVGPRHRAEERRRAEARQRQIRAERRMARAQARADAMARERQIRAARHAQIRQAQERRALARQQARADRHAR